MKEVREQRNRHREMAMNTLHAFMILEVTGRIGATNADLLTKLDGKMMRLVEADAWGQRQTRIIKS